MRLRKLRIAWSVVCGVACVLLIVLWVRSSNRFDDLAFLYNKSQGMVSLQTEPGSLCLTWQNANGDTFSEEYYSHIFNTQIRNTPSDRSRSIAGKFLVINSAVAIPFWFLCFISISLAAIPWIHWSHRFTLRTLLIATTLIALVLGLVVYAAR
jgi:hypothetical protein